MAHPAEIVIMDFCSVDAALRPSEGKGDDDEVVEDGHDALGSGGHDGRCDDSLLAAGCPL
jgi:hypothetical protein